MAPFKHKALCPDWQANLCAKNCKLSIYVVKPGRNYTKYAPTMHSGDAICNSHVVELR